MRNPFIEDTFLFYCGSSTMYPDTFISVHCRPYAAWIKMNKFLGSADYQMFHHSEVDVGNRVVKDINDLILPLGDANG